MTENIEHSMVTLLVVCFRTIDWARLGGRIILSRNECNASSDSLM